MAQTVRIEMDQTNGIMKKAGDSVERTRKRISMFDKSAEKTQRSLEKWAKEKYKILLEVKERITPVMQALGSSIMNFTGKTWYVKMKAVDLFTAPLRGTQNILKNDVSQMGEAASAAGVMQYSIEGAALSLGYMENAGEETTKLLPGIEVAGFSSNLILKVAEDVAPLFTVKSGGIDIANTLGFVAKGTGILSFGANMVIKQGAGAVEIGVINQHKSYDVFRMDLDNVKFPTEEQNESLYDSETSTEEFAKMYQEAVAYNLKKHFREVTLSLKELQCIADNIVLNKGEKNIQKYSETSDKTCLSQINLNSSFSELNKQNWKARLGMKLDEAEMEEYRTAVDNYMEDARTYLKNTYYQASLLVELLLGKDSSQDITGDLDQTYTRLEAKLNLLTDKLHKKQGVALADRVIEEKEQKEISEIQNKISSVDALQSSFVSLELLKKDTSPTVNFQYDVLKDNYRNELEGESRGVITSVIRKAADSVPEDQKKLVEEKFQDTIPTYVQSFIKEYMSGPTDEVDGKKAKAIQTVENGYHVVTFATNHIPNCAEVVSPNYCVTPFDSNMFFGKEAKPDNKGLLGSGEKDSHKKCFLNFSNENYPSRRTRALGLYKQAGCSLGVGEHADGGFVTHHASRIGENGSEKNTTIELNVSVNPKFTVNGAEGQNSEDVIRVIRRHIRELADELGGEIASQLEASFSNRPLKEA